MIISILDMETDGLLDTVTKIHCMCVTEIDGDNVRHLTFTDPESIRIYLENAELIVGHNIVDYDIPVAQKLLDADIKAELIDSLYIAWYLYPTRHEFGLESFGKDFGIEKPPISDWSNLTVEDYIHRCTEDVKINTKLFKAQTDLLIKIYGEGDGGSRLIRYLMFKADCAREQKQQRIKFDEETARTNLDNLLQVKAEKIRILSEVMPKVKKYKEVRRPKTVYKKDGTPSVHGEKWLQLLKEKELPDYHVMPIQVLDNTEVGNPGSSIQVKVWLDSLGWVPDTFKYVPEPNGSVRSIPQVSKDGELTGSVKALFEKEPNLEHLEGLYMVRHRIGLLEGFFENKSKDGFLEARISGLTNTLRFKHSVLVNMPTINRPYGKEIRECLISVDDHSLCGADMSSLEDNTKQHYMYYFDPDYVKRIRTKDFDPHLTIGVMAGMLTEEDETFFKWYNKTKDENRDYVFSFEEKERHKKISGIRKEAKVVNFASVYGAGPKKISLTSGMSLKKAEQLHAIYWELNHSVKKVSNACIVKTIGNQMWLFNPVSKLWYSLREEKDKFSTLNQGTGVYAFDTWIKHIRKRGIKICGQFHDEIITSNPKFDEPMVKQILLDAISDTNEELKLNIELGISIQFGNNYAEIH